MLGASSGHLSLRTPLCCFGLPLRLRPGSPAGPDGGRSGPLGGAPALGSSAIPTPAASSTAARSSTRASATRGGPNSHPTSQEKIMSALLISYDLRKPGQNYDKLYEKIKEPVSY